MSESWDRIDGEDLLEREDTDLVELWLCEQCGKGEGPSEGQVGKEGECSSCGLVLMLKRYLV